MEKEKLNMYLQDLIHQRFSEKSLQKVMNCIFLKNVELNVVDDEYLLGGEDFRIDFYCGDMVGSIWYLPTRDEDIFIITEIGLD